MLNGSFVITKFHYLIMLIYFHNQFSPPISPLATTRCKRETFRVEKFHASLLSNLAQVWQPMACG